MRFWPMLPVLLLLSSVAVAQNAHGPDVAAGEKVYLANCMACHGMAADGNGPAAVSLNPRPTDFTTPAFWASRTAGQVKDTIKTGKPGTPMMPFAQLTDADLSNLVAYLVSKKKK
ncbi:MAG: cytochrome c [Oligoflexia bacterium]|nr:cytochrome c [Oligoflexia bacterium]